MIENIIAKTMGVSRGELKKLASEGKVTAEVIKKAMTENADEIEAAYRKLPHTFADWATDIKSVAEYAFAPLFDAVNELANSPEFRQFVDSIENNIQYIAPIIKNVFNEISYAFKQGINSRSTSIWLATRKCMALYMVLYFALATVALVYAANWLVAACFDCRCYRCTMEFKCCCYVSMSSYMGSIGYYDGYHSCSFILRYRYV